MKNPEPSPAAARVTPPGAGETLRVITDHVRILADGAATGGRLFIFEESTPPGGGPPLHRHAHDDEYFYILEGTYRFVLDGRTFVAERGAFVAAPKGSLHTFCNAGDAPGRMLIVCAPAGLEDCFRKTARLAGPPTPEKVSACFEGWVRFEGPPIGP